MGERTAEDKGRGTKKRDLESAKVSARHGARPGTKRCQSYPATAHCQNNPMLLCVSRCKDDVSAERKGSMGLNGTRSEMVEAFCLFQQNSFYRCLDFVL